MKKYYLPIASLIRFSTEDIMQASITGDAAALADASAWEKALGISNESGLQ